LRERERERERKREKEKEKEREKKLIIFFSCINSVSSLSWDEPNG